MGKKSKKQKRKKTSKQEKELKFGSSVGAHGIELIKVKDSEGYEEVDSNNAKNEEFEFCALPSCHYAPRESIYCHACLTGYCSNVCKRAHRKKHKLECQLLIKKKEEENEQIYSSPAFLEFAEKHKEKWLYTTIPMLNDQTPLDACKTKEGRSLLENLMQMYESFGKEPSSSFNPDREWVAKRLSLPQPSDLTVHHNEDKTADDQVSFEDGEKLIITRYDKGPSLIGSLCRVAYKNELKRPPLMNEVPVFVYGREEPIFIAKNGLKSIKSIETDLVEKVNNEPFSGKIKIGDVALINGLLTSSGVLLNGKECILVSSDRHALGRYIVEYKGDDSTLEKKSIKEGNLQLLFRMKKSWLAPTVPKKKFLLNYQHKMSVSTDDTGNDRWYPDQLKADAVLCGSGNYHPNRETTSYNFEEKETKKYLGSQYFEEIIYKSLKALEIFRFHSDSYSALGRCFSEGPPEMKCATTSVIMYLRALHSFQILHPKIETLKIQWENLEYRPYIIAREGLAKSLSTFDYSQAAEEGLRLLNMNKENRNMRAQIVHWLISAGHSRRAEAFMDEYSSEDSDDVFFAFGKVLTNFYKYQVISECFTTDDWHPNLEASLNCALKLNPHVPEYLFNDSDSTPQIYEYSPGSHDEAMLYSLLAKDAWCNTVGALSWLSEASSYSDFDLGGKSKASKIIKGVNTTMPSIQQDGKKSVNTLEDRVFKKEASVAYPSLKAGIKIENESVDEVTLEKTYAETFKNDVQVTNSQKIKKDWFHSIRDDPLFIDMLGEWKCDENLSISLPSLENDTEQYQKNKEDMSGDPKTKLQHYCLKMYKALPKYCIISESGPPHNKVFKSKVFHELDVTIQGTGKGKSRKESEAEAATKAIQNIEQKQELIPIENIQTLRSSALQLPFAVRFQLERSLLNSEIIPIKIIKQPKGSVKEQKQRRDEVKYMARKLLYTFIVYVIPPLFKVLTDLNENENCITLIELFGDRIFHHLEAVKKDVVRMGRIGFNSKLVYGVLQEVRSSLKLIENRLVLTEIDLSSDSDFATIKRRATWPMAEYRCKFTQEGKLVPISFDIINLHSSKQESCSRRIMREEGWYVRDHFVLISNISFAEPFRSNVAIWIANKPNLCGREYEYFFDKGTGRPSCWLYSPTQEYSRDRLLCCLGNFKTVKPSKLGDRIGLAFTQTTPIHELKIDDIIAIPELTRNEYKFSDGCGVMGLGIAKLIKNTFKLETVPGAVQIRIGGVKGMLSLKEGFPYNKIGIRPSMVKFSSPHKILEVKQVAQLKDGNTKLFNQILLILDHLGIPDKVFHDLQEKSAADNVIKYDNDAESLPTSDSYDAKECVYFRKVLKTGEKANSSIFSSEEFKMIKKWMQQSQIKANLGCSITLALGIIDEHGILEEGQVLVGNGKIQGPVLVCRSPCNSPGDIQRADAVAKLSYEPFTNLDQVIIFSAKGDRPLPDMLAGGDLDGDEYFIINEADFIEKLCPAKAIDYGSQSKDILSTINVKECFSNCPGKSFISYKDQLEVFSTYMHFSHLVSYSADAWIRVADKEGAASQRAIDMAKLHQCALDARKGAVAIDQSQVQRMEHILITYKSPHWRGRGGVNPRKSSSILGVLHDHMALWILRLERQRQTLHCQGSTHALNILSVKICQHEAMIKKTMKRRDKEKYNRRKKGNNEIVYPHNLSIKGSEKMNENKICTELSNLHEVGTNNKNCSLCFQVATLDCPKNINCMAKYCDKDCADFHWLLGHEMACGTNIDCPICLEEVSNPFKLPCGHTICQTCLKNYFQGGYSDTNDESSEEYTSFCPVCRDQMVGYYSRNISFALGIEALEKANKMQGVMDKFSISDKFIVKYKALLQTSVNSFRQAIKELPNLDFAHCNLGLALLHSAEFEEAGKMLEIAIQRRPDDCKANYTLGIIRIGLNNHAEAISPLRQAVKYNTLHTMKDDIISEDYKKALHEALSFNAIDDSKTDLRFRVGDKVKCNVDEGWRNGIVSKLWFREANWPSEHPSSPYQVLIDDDEYLDYYVTAPFDDDQWIRKVF